MIKRTFNYLSSKYKNYKRKNFYIRNTLNDLKDLKFVKLNKDEKKVIKSYCKSKGFDPVYRYYEILKGNGIDPNPKYISWNNWCLKVLPKYNNLKICASLDDKNLYDLYFKNTIKMPETIGRRMNGVYLDNDYKAIDINMLKKIIQDNMTDDGLVLKASRNSSCGNDVNCFNNIDSIIHILETDNRDYIIERRLYNHDVFKINNLSSLSTIRIYTVLSNDRVNIVARILRVSQKSNSFVDNFCQGGAGVAINCDGQTFGELFDLKCGYHNIINDKKFVHMQIPFWRDIEKTVCDIAPRLSFSKIIAWDICVTNDGFYLIECNLGISDINLPQFVCKTPFILS